jgi:cell division transport system permease protein
MSAWFIRHLQTLIGSLGRLSTHWLGTTFTMLVIGIALALPACLHLLVTNLQSASSSWDDAITLSVYLKQETAPDEARRISERIRQRRDVAQVTLITADEGLKEFRRHSGFGEAIDALTTNPLPHALVIRPAAEYLNATHLETLATDLRQVAGVDVVQLDTAWVNRLNAILDAIQRSIVVTAGLLALGVMVIVGNTIRLDIQNRRQEIEVTKLVGGSNAFVRRPFLYSGVWYGVGGGIIAWIITQLIVAALTGPVVRLAGYYDSAFRLSGLGLAASGILLGTGVVLGWLGSFIAASRHLREIEPS